MGRPRVFGQATRQKGGTKYQRQFGNNSSSSGLRVAEQQQPQSQEELAAQRRAEYRRQRQAQGEVLDANFGYARYDRTSPIPHQRGWLFNMLPTTLWEGSGQDDATNTSPEKAALDLYFLTETGSTFKSTVLYNPYFYVLPSLPNNNNPIISSSTTMTTTIDSALVLESLISTLLRLYEGFGLDSVQVEYMVDLDEPNHLSPNNRKGRPVLKLSFSNVQQLYTVRNRISSVIAQNRARFQESTGLFSCSTGHAQEESTITRNDPSLSSLVEMREHDVPYVVRVCTDLNIRAGAWYTVTPNAHDPGVVVLLSHQNVERKADPSILAFDIECTKAPLKFPSADVDSIFMISYMVRGRGYLILSKHVVSRDVLDFEYTPKPSYPGPFTIFNEETEEALLQRFFDEYRRHRPQIVVTYNGDFFDWPFLETRARLYGLDVYELGGMECAADDDSHQYRGRASVHLDAFHWVQRDSYLPQGAQGLKAVTKYKLGYDPVEVDPEDMVRLAQERPVHMATYSVSDAVATYYLYEKYVHLFIFSLCTIIPMGPEDVLRKGSGTLCETLLMVQAFEKKIICPNKQKDPLATFHNGHLLESETYIGGKVECLETGVYRSDVEYEFDLKPSAFQMLIDNVDRDLTFAIQMEGGKDRSQVVNYNEIRGKIIHELEMLRDRPKRVEKPYIYHLDVGAMYPNIILTNRLQPSAIVDDATCAACDFNQAKNGCKRRMDWVWRGDYNPATKNEYDRTKDQLSREVIDGRPFHSLSEKEQESLVASRLKTYSRNAYKKTKVTTEENRQDTVCMRENDFYVDTVRCFRDRRYEYKKMTKNWKKKIGSAENAVAKKEAEDRALVYDSLQVAHKCILNSFYGYVMRKGARWRSMEMAGIVTKTGADLITQARILVEQIGRPLELDTDGIWCILPNSFPDVYTFEMADGGSLRLEYPCVMLNADVHEHFTNHQYQTLVDPARGIYETHSECSIFFEVDGPYRCMVLPSSLEEGKLLKKRYAVFNFDGSLAELKGFELKRRGELELIKTFQSQVFERFLDGSSLEECYDSVAEIANHWIDVLDTQGESLETDELVDLISENRNMSRQLDDYGGQKGTSQTTARRLGEFLGADIIKDKGLNCKFIIAEQPYGAPVTERAIPTAIWKAEPAVMKHYLRKWLKAPGLDEDQLDIRSVLDWDYYLDRLAKTIQKIITIPAALQKVDNPVPRVPHPDWLNSKVRQLNDRLQQQTITSMFKPKASLDNKPRLAVEAASPGVGDIEDFGTASSEGTKRPLVHKVVRAGRRGQEQRDNADEPTDLAEDRLPLSKEGFDDWLAQKKASWRKNRRERKRRGSSDQGVGRISTSTQIAKKPRAAFSSMEGYIRNAARTLIQSEWHVVEVREMSSYDSNGQGASSSGDFVLWVMVGNDSLQKVHISVPRTVHITTRSEIKSVDSNIIAKKVDRHLPHNKTATFTYEVTMPEHIYKSKEWTRSLQPTQSESVDGIREDLLETIYETGAPLMSRALIELGTVVKTNDADTDSGKARKTYSLLDLKRVARPTEGEYLHQSLSYKRVFLYNSVNARSKTGVVAVFILSSGKASDEDTAEDITRPSTLAPRTLCLNASCHLWIVKPGSRSGQKNVSVKQCEGLFSQLLETIQSLAANAESDGQQSEYSAVSPESSCQIASLKFADTEKMALSSANEVISSYAKANNGPTFLLINNSMPLQQLRRAVPSCNSFPVVPLPFPPGPAHNPSMRTLPALSWEPAAVQLCLESFFFMGAVSFPRRVSYARYGQVPIGNLGNDEALALYDVSFGRQLVKSRALTWASELPGFPDFGVNFLPSPSGGDFPSEEQSGILSNQNELWGDDDDELASPVIRRPGAYRCVCAEIDVHDLAIAALTDPSFSQQSAFAANQGDGGQNPSSPNNVTMFDASVDGLSTVKNTGPLGDEMSTALSLPLLRALIVGWLRDAFASNNEVADDMLHHVYRLVSSNLPLLDDPALHRVMHAMMKETFLRLLGELQRLGCTIVCASFHKVTISTNKLTLSEAEEYINFVIATIRNRSVSSESGVTGGLGRIALQPSTFYSQFLFLDEYNFGGIQLERRDLVEEDNIPEDLIVHEENAEGVMSPIIPTILSGWTMKNYLKSEIAQEYFRAIVGRYSKDVMRKQLKLRDEGASIYDDSVEEQMLAYKKKLISKHFATYMTRAVGEISKDAQAEGSNSKSEPLEFVKMVITVLDLDADVQNEVHLLKRSLLAQIGVPEYASSVKWKNPCIKFILPAVFCAECHESRDVNLCHLPDEEGEANHWACLDCGTLYPSDDIERRLIEICNRKVVRYQLQDLRCSKTNRVSTRAMAKQSDCSANLKLDISRQQALSQLQIIHDIAVDHELEWLQETLSGSLFGIPEFD